MLSRLRSFINWHPIEKELLANYKEGQKDNRGNKAYSPLLLFRAMLLQQWFKISSDPELESQINDRISFKKFLGIPIEKASPDHSIFSRFRKRVSNQTMENLDNILLNQLAKHGLSINEGIAVDARLVESASKPLSNKKLSELKEKRATKKGNLDKNGKRAKFQRDIEATWVKRDDKLHYGLKEHASVDINNGFILSTTFSPASHHESKYLPYSVAISKHTDQKIYEVNADKGYDGYDNRYFLSMNKIKDGIMRKAPKNGKLTQYEKDRNKKISKKRYIVEQFFGISHLHYEAAKARFTTIAKNLFDATCRQFAFNLKRGLRLLKPCPV